MENFKKKADLFFFCKGKERLRHLKHYIFEELIKNKLLILKNIINKSIIISVKTLKKFLNSVNKESMV